MSAIPAVNDDEFYLKAALIYCAKAGLDPEEPIVYGSTLSPSRGHTTLSAPRKDRVALELRAFDYKLAALLDARR